MKKFFLLALVTALLFSAQDSASSVNNNKNKYARINCCNKKKINSIIPKLKQHNSVFFTQPYINFKYSYSL